MVDSTSVDTLAEDLASLLADDTLRQKRHELRDFYFDSLAPGESTTRFWGELASAIHHHDAALRELSRIRHIEENA